MPRRRRPARVRAVGAPGRGDGRRRPARASTAPASRQGMDGRDRQRGRRGRRRLHASPTTSSCSATTRTCGPTRRGWPPASTALGARLAEVDGIDAAAVAGADRRRTSPSSRRSTPRSRRALAAVPAERRVLVTNHEVFGYFADRFDFEVLGAVIPSMTTGAAAVGGRPRRARRDRSATTACRPSSPRRPALDRPRRRAGRRGRRRRGRRAVHREPRRRRARAPRPTST